MTILTSRSSRSSSSSGGGLVWKRKWLPKRKGVMKEQHRGWCRAGQAA